VVSAGERPDGRGGSTGPPALEGYRELREDPRALAAFHRAAALVRPRVAARRDRLARGGASCLADAAVRSQRPAASGRFGMCGRLDVYPGPR
jgi:hypothetical protein